MSKFQYTEEEKKLNKVLKYQSQQLDQLKRPDLGELDERIVESESILRTLGYSLPNKLKKVSRKEKSVAIMPTWEELCADAEKHVGANVSLDQLFTLEELEKNSQAIRWINQEYNTIHQLDKIDITISATAGILGAAVDILLVGIPQKTPDGLKAGPLSNYIRNLYDEKFPKEEMEKLANSKVSKVPYDAQDNRNTIEYVEGLSSYYHRLLSLGHDPLLGLIFGVFDILAGRMTTIDKTGKIVSQIMDNYSDRKESDIFAAIAKQILHFKSDINTSMGIPAPLMSLFSLLQFGSIGDEEQTIAEIVQGMYYEGYDFIHFCSLAVPTMIVEVIIRLAYAVKRIREGQSIRNSIPFSLDREKNPKLCTMLFIGHSAATSINAGKIHFSQNPMAINYTQWLAFAKYSYKQLKWVMIEKPELRDKYVHEIICGEVKQVYTQIEDDIEDYIIVH